MSILHLHTNTQTDRRYVYNAPAHKHNAYTPHKSCQADGRSAHLGCCQVYHHAMGCCQVYYGLVFRSTMG